MQFTELHLALIAGGLGFVLLVWAINLWQERSLRRRITLLFGMARPGAKVAEAKSNASAEKVEPTLQAGAASGAQNHSGHAAADLSQHNINPVAPAPILDAQVDCIVELLPERPLSGELLNQIAQRLRHAGSKPVLFEGFQEILHQWQRPQAGQTYPKFRAGILLTNRSGALNAIEFSDFLTGLEAIASDVSALPDFPAMAKTLAHAQKLDQLCAGWDAQISLNVLLEDAQRYSTEALQSIVSNRGYIARPDGKYLALDIHGQVVFTIGFNLHAPHITLLLDVPRANPQAQPFNRMSIAANDLAQTLGGVVVDDALRPLAVNALAEIEQQLQERYVEMAEAGVPAGSLLALRLFN